MDAAGVAERHARGQPVEEALEAGALDLHRLERVEPVADVGDREARHVGHHGEAHLGAALVRALHVPHDDVDALDVGQRGGILLVGHGHDDAGSTHAPNLANAAG